MQEQPQSVAVVIVYVCSPWNELYSHRYSTIQYVVVTHSQPSIPEDTCNEEPPATVGFVI